MGKKLNRRDFVVRSAAAGLAVVAPRSLLAQAPAVRAPSSVKPVVTPPPTATSTRTAARSPVSRRRSE